MNFDELALIIQSAYESSLTIPEAEKHAARFLSAQMDIAEGLAKIDLDVRSRKNGLKAIKSAVYLEHAMKDTKKPSDVMLDALVSQSSLVQAEQDAFDTLEVERNRLDNYLSIFKDAHIFFRGVSKGRFE